MKISHEEIEKLLQERKHHTNMIQYIDDTLKNYGIIVGETKHGVRYTEIKKTA